MTDIVVDITIKSHGSWYNSLTATGDYEKVKEQIDLFYEMVKISMDKAIEKEVAYHEGIAKHLIK